MALALGAERVDGWARADRAVARAALPAERSAVAAARAAIVAGEDPLGDRLLALRAPGDRRRVGATYTPPALVDAMVTWGLTGSAPARVIDPGAGSARFAVAAGRRCARALLVGVELDPVAAILARAHLAAAGFAARSAVVCGDYCRTTLPAAAGPTLFIGNPPYVRHHRLSRGQKQWLARAAAGRGLRASRLAGLHVHFLFATAALARPGDRGVFVTAAEWLDVNYGHALRELAVRQLGLASLQLVRPTETAFADALTTAVICGFELGYAGPVIMREIANPALPGSLGAGRARSRERVAAAERWSPLFRAPRVVGGGVELGELCRVHRGQVTGCNAVWIVGPDTPRLPPAYLVPTITRARELMTAPGRLDDAAPLRRVIDLPEELDDHELAPFLRWARARGAADGYVARHRRRWWSVSLRAPAPILATYMARRPPVFVRNVAGARHLNIAHGVYPREPMSEAELDLLAARLNGVAPTAEGRVYAGGLVKFEPGEMARIRVPWRA
jgi:hypothetical protein